MEIAEKDELRLLPAMDGRNLDKIFEGGRNKWGIREDKGATLSTRTNEFPDE